MPQFYRPLGWGVCGRQTPRPDPEPEPARQSSDGVIEGQGGFWHVRPWRQVELNDLMALYDMQYAETTGTVVRSEDYWRWMIGREYAHVIWVACQGETVRGYAFVKDHKVLEMATDPAHPQALRALLGRVRAEALERAYPEVIVHAPADHPVLDVIRQASGRVIDQEEFDGHGSRCTTSPTSAGSSRRSCPSWSCGPREAGASLPLELGLTVGDRRWLIHVGANGSRVEPDKLSRRHLTLTPAAFVRLVMGHTGIDAPLAEDGSRPRRRRRSTPPASSSPSARSGAARSIARPPESLAGSGMERRYHMRLRPLEVLAHRRETSSRPRITA